MEKKPDTERVFKAIESHPLSWPLLALGMLGLIAHQNDLEVERRATYRWKRTDGTLISARVETYRGQTGSGSRGSAHSSTTYYDFKVKYRYQVAGRTYQRDRVQLDSGWRYSSRGDAEEQVGRLRALKTLPV